MKSIMLSLFVVTYPIFSDIVVVENRMIIGMGVGTIAKGKLYLVKREDG